MIFVKLSDLVVAMTSHQSVDKDDPMMFHYTVHFRDLVTGETAEISYTGENEAIMAVAAWLVSGEKNIGMLESHLQRLQDNLPKGFLP